MNTIDLNAANQSAVACWRELLRALDALYPRAWSGGLQQETSDIRFVLQGSQHKKAFTEVLAFFLSDLPVLEFPPNHLTPVPYKCEMVV